MRITALADMAGHAEQKLGGRTVARGVSIPAPVEGWDAISPKAAMSPKRAFLMDNWFPQPGYVEIRKGHTRYASTGTGGAVDSLMVYRGVTGEQMFCASGTGLYEVVSPSVVTNVVTNALSNIRFQHVNFTTTGGHYLYIVNGDDGPYHYDGTNWAVPTITGITQTNIIGINVFKARLWFIIKQSTVAAYLPVDSVQGAATTFELGSYFTRGGFLVAMATWSVDGGQGPEDYAVFMSSQGQAVIFSGINPASDFALVGIFDLGIPIGRRCFEKVGADLAFICVDGVVPLSKAMIFERAAYQKISLTENIQRVMNDSARLYGDNFGWQLITYSKGTRVVLNVPVRENTTQHQYVMNTLNRAWCRFTGDNANCFDLFNDDLYYGGNDGWIYLADDGGILEGNTPTETLTCNLMTSYNYYNTPGRQKRWTACQPLITSDLEVTPGIAFNPDFKTDAQLSVQSLIEPYQPLWDVAVWDVDVWGGDFVVTTNWIMATGIGQCASIRVAIDVEEGEPVIQLNGFNVTYEMGGFI